MIDGTILRFNFEPMDHDLYFIGWISNKFDFLVQYHAGKRPKKFLA